MWYRCLPGMLLVAWMAAGCAQNPVSTGCFQTEELFAKHSGQVLGEPLDYRFHVQWPVDCKNQRPLMPKDFEQFAQWIIWAFPIRALTAEKAMTFGQAGITGTTTFVMLSWLEKTLLQASGDLDWCIHKDFETIEPPKDARECAVFGLELALERLRGRLAPTDAVLETAIAYLRDHGIESVRPEECKNEVNIELVKVFFDGRRHLGQAYINCENGIRYTFDGKTWLSADQITDCVFELIMKNLGQPYGRGGLIAEDLRHCRVVKVYVSESSYEHLLPEADDFLYGSGWRKRLGIEQ